MKKGDVFPSKYLKALEVGESGIVLTITDVKMVEFKDTAKGVTEHKPVVFFAETKKGFPVNRTNWDLIAGILGDDSDDWKGGRIKIVVEEVEAFGKQTEGMRVVKPSKKK